MAGRYRRILDLSALARDGGVAFFLATLSANACNFFFHVAMSRQLGPSTYGALGSLLGMTTAVSLAVTAFQVAVTHAVVAERRDHAGEGRPLFDLRRPMSIGIAVAGALGVALVAASVPVEGFLHLSGPLPVVLFAASVTATVAAVVPQGVLIGRLRFRPVAAALAIGSVVRLVTGVVLVHGGGGLDAAVGATSAGSACSLIVVAVALRAEHAGRGAGEKLRLHPREGALSVAALSGTSLFVAVDYVLARHFLTGRASGFYVAAATASRIALFLPAAVGLLAFPRMASADTSAKEARAVLRHALVAVSVLGVAATVVLLAVPGPIVSLIFGSRYAPAVPALRILAAASAAFGVVLVLVYALLARRSPWSLAAWAAIVALSAGIVMWHSSPLALGWVVLVVTAGLLGAAAWALVARPALRARVALTGGTTL
ncbi:MAG: oligosaccharide flippase family protein [Acidimicrobiales bacterium]